MTGTERFTGCFTEQEPVPEPAIARVAEILRSGRLHRYSMPPAESETALLEQDFAAFTGARHALAVASGGYALRCALRAVGVAPGDAVLTNAFTLAPVPGAIAGLGAVPVLVETTEDLVIDLDDLAAKLPRARVLLLSHMRGHICDMDRLMALCDRGGVTVIEDCAHTMGAEWRGTPSGRHGAVGCYSTQSYKHINSGEGGLLVTGDAALAARMVLSSGAYAFQGHHPAGPGAESYTAGLVAAVPNLSGRMDEVRAAVLRPQLALLPERVARWAALNRARDHGAA